MRHGLELIRARKQFWLKHLRAYIGSTPSASKQALIPGSRGSKKTMQHQETKTGRRAVYAHAPVVMSPQKNDNLAARVTLVPAPRRDPFTVYEARASPGPRIKPSTRGATVCVTGNVWGIDHNMAKIAAAVAAIDDKLDEQPRFFSKSISANSTFGVFRHNAP